MYVPILIGVGVVAVIALVVWAIVAERKRSEALSECAAAMGLQFDKHGDSETARLQSQFELFTRGRGRTATNLIYGETNGTGVWLFDYRYTTGHGKHSRTHAQSIACFASAQLELPRFSLYREGIMSRIGSVLGMQDIDFDSHPEFSKQYVLKGDSEDDVRETFHDEILSFFETQDKRLRVEGNNDLLLVYRASTKVKPMLLQDFLQEGFGIFRMFLPA